MGKNPAFLFFPNDWIGDPELQQASASTRGIWSNFLCHMWWARSRGVLAGTESELCRLGGCTTEELHTFIEQNNRLNFADVTLGNNLVTISNRRMVREEKARESARYRVQRHRNKTSNANVTLPSPVPSTPVPSTPVPSPKKKRILLANPDGFAAFWNAYPKKLGKDAAEKAWNRLDPQNGLVELILSSIVAHCHTQQWSDIQYVPYPATFLNGRRWEDDLLTVHHETAAERLWREAQEEKHAS